MIQRIKKISGLLALAATLTCCLSLTSADASTKLNTKDGSMISAVAYDKGNMMFYGYKTDDDDTSLYYDNGYDYKEVKDAADYEYYNGMSKYGKKYITAVKDDNKYDTEGESAEEPAETYLVDLSNGQIDEDETVEDRKDEAALKLHAKLNKTDRYENTDVPEMIDFQNNSFGEKWYMYTVAPNESKWSQADTTTVYLNNETNEYKPGQLYGFADDKGAYVDASHRAEVYAYSQDLGKMVYMDDFNSQGEVDIDEDGVGTRSDIVPSLEFNLGVVAEDKDYIYSMIGVSFKGDASLEGRLKTYIQKVSKKPGDKLDGANLPLTVESYELSDKFSSTGALRAADLFQGKDTGYKSALDGQFSVKDGQLYLTQININGDKVRVTKINLAKENTSIDGNDVEACLVEADNGVEQSISKFNDYEKKSSANFQTIKRGPVSKDVNNNIWALDNGTIYKFDGEKFKEQFVCDRSLNQLDVYNGKNLVAWNSNGDCYASLQDGRN